MPRSPTGRELLLRFAGRAAVPGFAGPPGRGRGDSGLVRGAMVMLNPLYSFVAAE